MGVLLSVGKLVVVAVGAVVEDTGYTRGGVCTRVSVLVFLKF